jgi:hypothetical protein
MSDRELYLGADPGSRARVTLDMGHLTTHAVCLGMTGSGKTGLGIVALEELARRGVPMLVIDLKGDMIDLLLNFPDLAPDSFEPWLATDLTAGRSHAEVAREQAELWTKGLAGSGLDGGDLRAVKNGLRWQLLTPGVASMAPVDILPALAAPSGWDPATDPDGATDRVNGVTGAILSFVGRGGDPLSDRDHVLTASVILDSWNRRRRLDFPGLLASLADPPMAALGALPIDVFYPRDERMKLVLALNTLLASPAFAAWTQGTPLTMDELLGSERDPRATILSVAHLDDRQRLFVIGLAVTELVAWMRRQSASAGLRALLYMDEVQGILPPHPANPPTKQPLLTLFKQGRAFGIGAWLATQNPVDLDYKALGNAGIKLIGRLITERDRDRALEGLGLERLDDGSDTGRLVAALGKREFLLDDVRSQPRIRMVASRWAMSYLRGPVALAEMAPLVERVHDDARRPMVDREPEGQGLGSRSGPSRPRPPVLEHAFETRFGVDAFGEASPAVLVRCRTGIHRTSLGLDRELEEVWRVEVDADGRLLWSEAEILEHAPETLPAPPEGLVFPVAAPSHLGAELSTLEREFVRWRARRAVEILANPQLTLVAEPDEDRDRFVARCREAADRADDATQDRARARYQRRIDTVKTRLGRERDELARDRQQLASRQVEETVGVVEGLLNVLLGSRSISSASRKAASKLRSAAGKRRMRQSAESSVTESEQEIDRLEVELQDLAAELQAEVDRIAEASEAVAEGVEVVPIRPIQKDIEVKEVVLVWL